MKWEKVEYDRGKQGAFRDISLVHRKKNCEFTFHRLRDGKKKRGKGSVKERSRLMNFVKKTSKRENTIENHVLPPVHVQWKEENQYKNESLFSACGEGEKEVPYIFFHNFTACQWKLTANRRQGLAPSAPCIINAPAGRHRNPLNLLNPRAKVASDVSTPPLGYCVPPFRPQAVAQ